MGIVSDGPSSDSLFNVQSKAGPFYPSGNYMDRAGFEAHGSPFKRR